MIERFIVAVLVIAVCMALVVCGGEPEPTPTPIVIIVEVTPEPTPTPIPRPTETSTPTPDPTHTVTPNPPTGTPVPTEVPVVIIPPPTQTPYPTYTPYPTFTPVPPRAIPPTYTPYPTFTPVPTAEPLVQNIVAIPTVEPTPTLEPVLKPECVQSGDTEEFVLPISSDGTTKLTEPLPGVVFRDTIQNNYASAQLDRDGVRKEDFDRNDPNRLVPYKRVWAFQQYAYQHCETEDPWKPEYLVIGDKEVSPPPRQPGEFVQRVFTLGLHERSDKSIVFGELEDDPWSQFVPHSQFAPHPDSGRQYKPWSHSTFHLSEPSATLYIWTNRGTCEGRCSKIGDWPILDKWQWRPVSKGGPAQSRYQLNPWRMPLMRDHVPSLFAAVARNQ